MGFSGIHMEAISQGLSTWWRHQMETFSALLALCAGNSPVPGEFPHKGQWRRALMFSLIYVWINGWVNNHEAGDLRRNQAHYDVIVMRYQSSNKCENCSSWITWMSPITKGLKALKKLPNKENIFWWLKQKIWHQVKSIFIFNSLWLIYTMWHHKSWLTLATVMIWCLVAPCLYLKQWL